MNYGVIKVDRVTFTDAGIDKSVTLSGLVQNPTFSGNVTVTGTFSGVTVTGTTANFTSGNFTNISGGIHTITSGVFAAGSATNPSITFTGNINTGVYSPGTNQIAISTSGTGRLFIGPNGNMEIISTASVPLQVSASFPRIRLNDSDGTNLTADFGTNNGITFIDSRNDTANGAILFRGLGGGIASEYMRLDSSGRLLVGSPTSTNNADTNDKQAIVITGGLTGGQSIVSYAGGSSTETCATIDLKRSRGTTDQTMTAHGAITGGWKLGELIFSGTDGTSFSPGASISARTDGSAWTTGDTPGVLVFSTTADGESSPTEEIRMAPLGRLVIPQAFWCFLQRRMGKVLRRSG